MGQNSTFKHTPIPHTSKSGEPTVYYTLSEMNEHIQVTRSECLAQTNEPDNPYPQRWFVDEEAGLVVRLPRNEMGERIARENMRSIWREQKYQERKYECVLKGTEKCDGWQVSEDGSRQCEYCQKRNVNRTLELDSQFGRESEAGGLSDGFEVADDADIALIAEDNALLDTLRIALSTLTQESQDLVRSIFRDQKTERELAMELGLKEPKSVNKRKQRLLEILRKNAALKAFFD